MKWITSNPAKAAGIYEQTGSLKVGKNADLVVWSGDPFSVYTKAKKFILMVQLHLIKIIPLNQ